MVTDAEKIHLGGYVAGPHGDEATYYPDLWEWFIYRLHVKSMVDVGCGSGATVRWFQKHGVGAYGIDGLDTYNGVIVHDYTLGSHTPWEPVDLIWTCEFCEHVPEQYMPNFLETFKSGRYVALCAAGPGQAGHHHVNCKPEQYWIGALASIGFEFDDVLTKIARLAAKTNSSPYNHFTARGLMFTKYGANIKAYPRSAV